MDAWPPKQTMQRQVMTAAKPMARTRLQAPLSPAFRAKMAKLPPWFWVKPLYALFWPFPGPDPNDLEHRDRWVAYQQSEQFMHACICLRRALLRRALHEATRVLQS